MSAGRVTSERSAPCSRHLAQGLPSRVVKSTFGRLNSIFPSSTISAWAAGRGLRAVHSAAAGRAARAGKTRGCRSAASRAVAGRFNTRVDPDSGFLVSIRSIGHQWLATAHFRDTCVHGVPPGGSMRACGMATKTPVRPALSDAQLAELMTLLGGSDTVELKLTVPASQQRAAIRGLALDALDAQIRQVVFFDTPDLALDRAGVVVRARRIQGRAGDSVIKLRPLDPAQVDGDLRRLSGFGVEVDAIPGGFVCSGRLKCEADSDAIRRVVLGERAVRKLFTKEQRTLYEAHAPDGIGLNDLAVLGPIFVLKLKWQPRDFARKMVAEMWLYPSGERIFELSTKCLPTEAFQVAAEARVYLTKHGVDLSGEQQTKTRTALEFFAGELEAG